MSKHLHQHDDTRIHIRPARAGESVLDPTTNKPLPDKGKEVVRSAYWLRRINAGDVLLCPRSDHEVVEKPKRSQKKEKPSEAAIDPAPVPFSQEEAKKD